MRNLAPARSSIDVDRLNLIASFVSVAEHLSFIAAANVIGTSPSTVSRKVSRLEDALGLRLFERTTRRVALTEAGRLYHAQCVQIFNHLADADAMIASLNSEPSGLLRVSFPVAWSTSNSTMVYWGTISPVTTNMPVLLMLADWVSWKSRMLS